MPTPTQSRPGRALPADPFGAALADMDEAGLVALFERRPDLAERPPLNLAALFAAAAASPSSVARAVHELDAFTLQVLQAVTTLDGHATAPQVVDILGPPATAEAVLAAAAGAEHCLLTVVDADGCIDAHPALVQVLPSARLGPPMAALLDRLTVEGVRWLARQRQVALEATRKADLVSELAAALSDPAAVLAVLEEASLDVGERARRMATSSPVASCETSYLYSKYYEARGYDRGNPLQWLARYGLVVRANWYEVVMPREVALALRGGRLFARVDVERPPVRPGGGIAPDEDLSGAEAAARVVARIEAVVDELGAAPAKLLKTGGVGVRELRRLARAADVGEVEAPLLAELAAAAGLVTQRLGGLDTPGEVLPTSAYDEWCELGVPGQWEHLVTSWIDAERWPGLAGSKNGDEKTCPALMPQTPQAGARRARLVVLGCLAELPEGVAPASEAELLAATSWTAPVALAGGPATSSQHLRWAMAEAGTLGLVKDGAITVLARRLVAGDAVGARQVLAGRVGEVADEIVLQADLTAVAPSAASRRFRAQLALLADVESSGPATVFRFSEALIGRALEAGQSAGDIAEFLDAHAARGVPQPLSYLVEDTARRHGQVRVGGARSFVRFVDEATATEALRDRRTSAAALRQIAPTVLVSDRGPSEVYEVLRSAGFLPTEEDGTGNALVHGRPRQRASGPALQAPPVSAARGRRGADLAGIARRVLKAGLGPAPPAPAARFSGPRLFDDDDLLELVRLAGRVEDLVDPDEIETAVRLQGMSAVGAMECPRPTEIAKGEFALGELLEHADVHDWTVRVEVALRRGRPESFFAEVDQVGKSTVTLWNHDAARALRVRLSEISWARVLTLAEEEAVFEDDE